MSVDGWNRILVLGGIRSGKSEFAVSLVSDQDLVRYVVVAADSELERERAGRIRVRQQPPVWTVAETGGDPTRLIELIAEANPGETLVVDDLGGWVSHLLDPGSPAGEDSPLIDALAAAVRDCPARLVLVSPEVGLTPAPVVPAVGRAYVHLLGATNQAVSAVCDTVALVVAGRPIRLGGRTPATLPAPTAPVAVPPAAGGTPAAAEPGDAWTAPTAALPIVAAEPAIEPGMDLPLPDDAAASAALTRLTDLDFAEAGLGNLERVVRFAAATQGTATPTPWHSARVLLLHGDYDGAAAAGVLPGESSRRADQARGGVGPLARLAAEAGADLQVVPTPTAAPIEHGPALAAETVESALRLGYRLASQAADDGVDVLVLAACGAGADTAAAAVLAATAGADPFAVLPRVTTPNGFDDAAWMVRAGAVRDALHRTRRTSRAAKDVLAELAGGEIAVATGVLLGAAARGVPVLLDGPVGVAAGLVSRDLAGQARHWCLLPDDGGHPGVRLAADVLGLTPVFDLRLDLGEGATSLAVLPVLRSALTLAAHTPVRPASAAAPDDRQGAATGLEPAEEAEFIEPEPAGPGPTATGEITTG